MNKQTLIAIASLVLAGSMVGISVYQHFAIVSLNTRNNDLSLSVSQKTQENDILKEDYDRLNSTYFQLLSSLQTVTDSLKSSLQTVTALFNSSESELSLLQEDYLNLLESYNNLSDYCVSLSTNLTAKVSELKDSIGRLSQEFGGLDGIFVLNYNYTKYAGITWQHTFTLELYNALETANVTVKVYGQGSKTFSYSMPAYSRRVFAEYWPGGGIGEEDYSLVIIESVERE